MSNPPWWEGKEGIPFRRRWRAGVRAGSRWPFTQISPSSPGKWRWGDYLPYPMFMGYATTYLRKASGVHVNFRDSICLRESYKSYFRHLSDEKYDYIFIETATPSWENDSALIRQIRKVSPGSKIVICGPICATRGDQIISEGLVHACIKGEYEKGSQRVINGESGLIEFDLLTEEEMNAAPYPYYEEVYVWRYWDGLPVGQVHPHAQVWSSRGCPYRCIFCVWPATMTGNDPDGTGKRTVRRYSADYMEGFLGEITERFPLKSIYFDDDTFNLGDRHVIEMCGVMTKIGLPWSAMCRADTIKLETWRIMKESGCFGVKLGFESGNQWVLDHIVRKNLDLDQAREVVTELKRLGMTVHGAFTYGLPGETEEQMLDTRRFIKSLSFDSVQESGTAVIEGTPLDTLIREGRLEKYEGAVLDSTYRVQLDGHKKLESMLKSTRTPGVRVVEEARKE